MTTETTKQSLKECGAKTEKFKNEPEHECGEESGHKGPHRCGLNYNLCGRRWKDAKN